MNVKNIQSLFALILLCFVIFIAAIICLSFFYQIWYNILCGSLVVSSLCIEGLIIGYLFQCFINHKHFCYLLILLILIYHFLSMYFLENSGFWIWVINSFLDEKIGYTVKVDGIVYPEFMDFIKKWQY